MVMRGSIIFYWTVKETLSESGGHWRPGGGEGMNHANVPGEKIIQTQEQQVPRPESRSVPGMFPI